MKILFAWSATIKTFKACGLWLITSYSAVSYLTFFIVFDDGNENHFRNEYPIINIFVSLILMNSINKILNLMWKNSEITSLLTLYDSWKELESTGFDN